jgi:hypothetical protein
MKRAFLVTTALMMGCSTEVGAPAQAPNGPAPMQTDVTQLATAAGSSHFSLRMGGGNDLDVLVSDRSLTGIGLSLTRYTDASDHAIRGSAFKRTVDLDLTADGAKGLLGGGPMDVKVELVGDELRVNGLVSGQTSAFSVTPREITGNVGRCMFQMARQGGEYFGTRGCGTGKASAYLSFPAAFGAWSLSELGAALAILFTSGM